ncbi:nucleoside triphosphate pyrophosphohydrolase family protein [Paenibacillus senegalensis]|uniref:hypothetical protein n=1 Tax=Paenibacillus senegalensis TaxID=1465766 RepID=UPI0002884E37|nr:hypothetical protein [Paenibacillus senegalensis]
MNIKELVEKAHQNAVSKGWWEKGRTYGELIVLVHSEVSEALEDHRNGHAPTKVWYEFTASKGNVLRSDTYRNSRWKPCGIPSELADVCIRIFDIAGKYGWGEELHEKFKTVNDISFESWYVNASLPEHLNHIYYCLSMSWIKFAGGLPISAFKSLATCLGSVQYVADKYGIDLERAIAEKMAYNATRPRRHGGKVL